MASSTKNSLRLYAAICRVGLVLLGVVGVSWALFVVPDFWRSSKLNQVAIHIFAGEPFKEATLRELSPALEEIAKKALQPPRLIQSAAVIHLRLAENERQADKPPETTPEFDGLETHIFRALANNPTDSFLWLTWFWLKAAKDGFNDKNVAALRLSYQVGPHEGWIAVRRNRLAAMYFAQLPQDLAEPFFVEFKELVEWGYQAQAAGILVGPGWPIRELLLSRLATLPEATQRQFTTTVAGLGRDIAIPGLKPLSRRPWQH
jgi:hypothetical protein